MNLFRFQARKIVFSRCKEKSQNRLFEVSPTKWTWTFWGRQKFYFSFSLASTRPNKTSEVSKGISFIWRMFLRKFWSNKEWICFLFKPEKKCIQDVNKKLRIVSLKSPQPNGHWFLKYVKFLFCLFSVFYGSTLEQWSIQKYLRNQENVFGIVLEQ